MVCGCVVVALFSNYTSAKLNRNCTVGGGGLKQQGPFKLTVGGLGLPGSATYAADAFMIPYSVNWQGREVQSRFAETLTLTQPLTLTLNSKP